MPLHFLSHARTDVGCKRKNNEDSLFVDEQVGVYLVADGMGGHQGGEVASSRAVQVVAEVIRQQAQVLQQLKTQDTPGHRLGAQQLVEYAIQAACADIHALATTREDLRGMGTTLVGLVCVGNSAVLGNVGDSRAYLIRGGRVHHLTEDHTLFMAQLKQGKLTPEQIAQNKNKSVLTRAVGVQESVQVDTLFVELQPGDLLLLCSDGLHGYLADAEIPALVAEPALDRVTESLIGLAKQRGGKDNITTVVVRVEGYEEVPEGAKKIDFLLQLALFQHLDYKEAAAVLAISDTKDFAPDSVIVTEGEEGEELFVVTRGKVSVESGGVQITELGPGGHFGEMGLMQNAPRSATVRALVPSRALVIRRQPILELMRLDQTLAVKLLWSFVQVLSQRLRSVTTDLSAARQELEAFESRPTLITPSRDY